MRRIERSGLNSSSVQPVRMKWKQKGTCWMNLSEKKSTGQKWMRKCNNRRFIATEVRNCIKLLYTILYLLHLNHSHHGSDYFHVRKT